jgi:hypothetical protein
MRPPAKWSNISTFTRGSGNALISHGFLVKAAENAEPPARKIIDWLVTRGRRGSPPRLPPRQSYHAGVFWGARRLSYIPSEIEVCEIFIARTPSSSYLKRLGFGQKDYIHNHFYAYLTLMESSYDWGLRLSRSVFNLGEPPAGFEGRSPLASEWMERTGVSHELRRLASRAKAVRQIRYAIVTPMMIRDVNLLTEPFLKSCLYLAQAAGRSFDKGDAKGVFSDTVSPAEISTVVGHVAEQRSYLTRTIGRLLDNLLPVYEKWTGVFSSVKY